MPIGMVLSGIPAEGRQGRCRILPPHYFGPMKTLRYPAFMVLALSGLAAFPQITITQADMPSAGDTVRYRTTTTTANAATTGAGHTWDFSSLVAGAAGADTMVAVGSTPLAYQLFFNNALLYPDHKANFAMRGPSIGMQGVSLTNLFDYYKNNSAGYRNVGFGANMNGLPTSTQRNPVDWVYRFPVNYGNVDSSFSHFQVSVPTLGFYGQDQMRRNEVDGWGTLILPADTFEVLRVKSRLARTDTIYINQLNMGFAVPEPETIEYKWIAMGMKEPVLQINTSGGANTLVRFYHHPGDITTGVAQVAPVAGMRAWPNPASALLHVEGSGDGPLLLLAPDGRVVRTVPSKAEAARGVDVSGMAPGTYVLRSAGNGGACRVVVAH